MDSGCWISVMRYNKRKISRTADGAFFPIDDARNVWYINGDRNQTSQESETARQTDEGIERAGGT
jgi:hypothetical protein